MRTGGMKKKNAQQVIDEESYVYLNYKEQELTCHALPPAVSGHLYNLALGKTETTLEMRPCAIKIS